PLMAERKAVPPMVVPANEAWTLWLPGVSAEGLKVVTVATPEPFVVAEPAGLPSTLKLMVAPTTAALVSFLLRVAVKVTPPVDPRVTEAVPGAASVRVTAELAKLALTVMF